MISNTPKILDIYTNTNIWEHFKKVADTPIQTIVIKHVSDAIALLDHIVVTFPTYTLHNGQHQLNILHLYSEILGERINELTSLETAILILGAFYHDIGMVFSETNKNNLINEQWFDSFLDSNDGAKLEYLTKGMTAKLAEWYCRWSHAKRIWIFINPKNSEFAWNALNIRTYLGEVCQSHNEKLDYVKDDEKFPSELWTEKSDMKFCAILLRLADVLDFDSSRTPKSVYDYLGLDTPNAESEEISKREWNKHFVSEGFTFENWNKNINYTLNFNASPKDPAIHHEISSFLNYIETEMHECSTLLKFCSDRWKNFKFPDNIERKNIIADNYKFGDFKFSLDQQQVLSLLMGESLYESKYVFIRELLQNAIDTSRHRKFYEHNNSNKDFEPAPISVSTWHDDEGYRWIRIDDYGMGMSLVQIEKYFLKVGNSYYNSDEFRVEKLSYKNSSKDFVPVSRFGVGVLSCFIIGDIVEVSTLSVHKNTFPIRLSLQGMHNYYVLQTKGHIPNSIPIEGGYESGYRQKAGTSVAVRIKPNFDLPSFDLSRILDSILFNPEVSVILNGIGLKGQYLKGIEQRKDIITRKFTEEEIIKALETINDSDIKSINPEIKVIPVNLELNYSHPNIRGFLYLFLLSENIEYLKKQRERNRMHIAFYNNSHSSMEVSIKNNKPYKPNFSLKLNELLESIELFHGKQAFNELYHSIVLSHNGILIKNKARRSENKTIDFSSYYSSETTYQILGYVQLSDTLRPNLSVSRGEIKSIPWSLWSSLNYTIRKNIPLNYLDRVSYFDSIRLEYDSKSLNEDPLLTNSEYWASEKIFKKNIASLVDLLDESGEVQIDEFFNYNNTEDVLKKKIIELYADYSIVLLRESTEVINVRPRSFIKKRIDGLYMPPYPPLSFCKYENFQGLKPIIEDIYLPEIYNISHPFSRWLIESYTFLEQHYPNQLYLLMNSEDINILNSTTKKLREHLPDKYKPSKELILTKKDFEVDILSLPSIDEELS